MELREGENILKVYHHHPTPFLWILVKVAVSFSPFYLFIYLFQGSMSMKVAFIINLIFFVILILVLLYLIFIYWLDRLIITNHRIIFKDYKFLTVSEESQASIYDIQDIVTKEKGILSYFLIFDYGLFRIETAASKSTVIFENAPNPEGIRQYIFEVRKTHYNG